MRKAVEHQEAARVVDRDVKNVHEELNRLARLGIIYYEEDGRSKRPVVCFNDPVIELPFKPEPETPRQLPRDYTKSQQIGELDRDIYVASLMIR